MQGIFFYILLTFLFTVDAVPSTNNECRRPTQKIVTRAYSITDDQMKVPSYAQYQHMCQIETNTTTFTFDRNDVIDTSGKWIIYFGVSPNLNVKIDNKVWQEFTQESDKFYFAHVDQYPEKISFTKQKASSEPFFIISPSLFKHHSGATTTSATTMIVSLGVLSFFLVLCGWIFFWIL